MTIKVCVRCGQELRRGQYLRGVKTLSGYEPVYGGAYFLCRFNQDICKENGNRRIDALR